MSAKKLEWDPSDLSPVERVQKWVHGAYDRIIDPTAVGATALVVRGLRSAALSVREVFRSIHRS
ncbi:MAG: hypothetical protein WC353_02390 [Candidatus Peribacter sp.]|jgi:hypothetical protein